jgi:uncharacterized protein YdeI (YjbR/CyaY-like superfamily)
VKEIGEMKPILKAYLHVTIEIEKVGLIMDGKEKDGLVLSEELIRKMAFLRLNLKP